MDDTTLEALAPIGLADVEDVAAFQSRTDRKYVVPEAAVDDLVGVLGGSLWALTIDGRRRFVYESTYFDTPGLALYLAAARRRPSRAKVRIRRYDRAPGAMLEVKVRSRDGLRHKHRTPATGSADGLCDDDRRFVANTRGSAYVDVEALRPTLMTSYERSTLVATDVSVRLTIDRDVVCSLPEGPRVTVSALVVETKSTRSPSFVDRWLWHHHFRPVRISKYATSLAVLRPDLPSNKWHRTIRRHVSAVD